MGEHIVAFSDLASANLLEVGAGRPRSAGLDRFPLPILRVADVAEGKVLPSFQINTPVTDSQDMGPKTSKPGDVVLTTKGTVGRVAIMPSDGPTFAYSPQLCYFRPIANGPLRARYLYYWFKSEEFWNQADALKGQTDMADFISLSDLCSIRMRLPSIDEQVAAIGILGALDDKIAANEIALGLIESYLAIQFERALAQSTTSVALGEAADFHNRKRVPLSSREREERRGRVPYYGAAGRLDFVDEALFDRPLVLVGEDGSVIDGDGTPVVQYIWGPTWVNNHAHVLTGKGMATETLRCALKRSNVAHLVTGAVQPKISMGNLKTLKLAVPTDVGAMDVLTTEFAAITRAKWEENEALARTRDQLLPLLMSGKLRVKDAETLVADVT